MGLDICTADRYTEDFEDIRNLNTPTAQWSYSGFHRFRQLLAAEDGIDLEFMVGFHRDSGPGRSWDSVTTTLTPLLNHSDCDGELTPADCTAILPRLKEIRVTWAETDAEPWDVQHLDALIDVVTYSAATGVNVLFH
jgi:hypothetical protein